MLGWAVAFLVVAMISGIFGFGGVVAASAGIAQVVFVVFLILFALSLIAGLLAEPNHTSGIKGLR